MLTHGGLINGGIIWAQCLKIPADEKMLIALPMFHLAAGLSALGGVFLGAEVAIEPRFDPPRLVQRIEQLRISMMIFVPAVLDMLIRTPEFEGADTPLCGEFPTAGRPCQRLSWNAPCRHYPASSFIKYTVRRNVGMTSCLEPRYHTMEGPDASKRTTAGKVAIGMDFRICDPESGTLMPTGTAGEVEIRGPSITPVIGRRPTKPAISSATDG